MSTVKDEIVQGALKAFSTYGFKQTSMSTIAEEAGLSRQALYNHFSNKEDVLVALVSALQMKAAEITEVVMQESLAKNEELIEATCRMIDARFEVFLGQFSNSDHFQELMSVHSQHEKCADLNSKYVTDFSKRLAQFFKDMLEKQKRVLVKGLTSEELARLMIDSMFGLKNSITQLSPKSYRTRALLTIRLLLSGAIER